MGFLTALARISLDMTVVTLIILWMPGFPPNTTFNQFEFPSAPAWTGALQRNEKLNIVDKLFENQIKGPESFAVKDGYLYTGLMSGIIVRIDTEDLSITPIAKIGQDCAGQHEDVKCGRPLGLTFTSSGKLLVCDAVLGLYLIDLDRPDPESGRITSYKTFDKVSYELLLSPETVVDGLQNVVFNSVAIGSDNKTVYLSVSSTRFPLRDSMFELLSDPSGRILQFDLETRETKVLVEEVHFANGLELSPEEDFLVYTETGRASVHKYYLKGPKRGELSVLTSSLPGLPDNIKLNDRGNYYVGLYPRLPATHHILDLLSSHNLLRKFISRLVSMVLIPAKILNQTFGLSVLVKFEYWCGNLEPFAHLTPPYGLLVELDGETGEVVSSMHSTNGAVRFISEAVVLDRWIYLGSPYNHYLARVPKRLRDSEEYASPSGVYLGQSEGSLDTESQEFSLDDNSQAITSQEDDDEGSYVKDEL